MVRWAILFFIIALIAAVFGFTGLAGDAAWVGKVLLVVFLILAVVSAVLGRGAPPAGWPGMNVDESISAIGEPEPCTAGWAGCRIGPDAAAAVAKAASASERVMCFMVLPWVPAARTATRSVT